MLLIYFMEEKMNNNNDDTNKIDNSKTLKDISETLKPKPKKPNYGIAIAWAVIGVVLLYVLYQLDMFFKL